MMRLIRAASDRIVTPLAAKEARQPMSQNSMDSASTLSPVRTRSLWSGALVLVVLTLIATALVSRQSAEAGTSAPTVLASDKFARTVAKSWGTADLGGSWTVGSAPATTFAVAGGVATMSLLTNGQGPAAWLNSVSSANTDLSLSVGTDKVATGSGTYIYVVGRNVSGVGSYVAKLRFKSGGGVSLTLERRDSKAAEFVFTPETTIAGLTTGPGKRVQVRLQVTGTSPTTVQAKVWAAGTTEPSAWTLTKQDSTKELQKAGSVGVSGYLSRGATNAPVALSFDGLSAVSTLATTAVSTPTPTPSSASPTPTPKPTPSVPAPAPTPAQPSATPTPTPTVTQAPAPTSGRATSSAGAAAVGSTRYAVPAGAIFVSPAGNDSSNGSQAAPVATVARAVALAASGSTIVLRGGTYHQSVTLPAGKTLTVQSYPGEAVWFDGSTAVTGWVRDGNGWRVDGWMSNFDHSPTYTSGAPDSTNANWAFVNPNYPMAAYPDQVWIDGSALQQVGSVSQLTAGTFYVDTAGHRLYVGSDPSGRAVLSSDLTTAFTVSSDNSVLRGFGVHRYATSVPMMGTVRVFASGVTLENMVVSDNATQGISVIRVNGTLRHITAQNNGLLGIHANYADGLRASGILATNNNTQHFNTSPVSGGFKITRSRNVSITDSVLSSNNGPGLWLDESVYNATITGNDASSNLTNGIVVEISDTMVVANNVLTSNGGNGVKLDNTGDVRVWNNTFSNNNRDLNITQDPRDQYNLSDAGHDPRQKLPDATVPWRSSDIDVHNNVFNGSTGNALFAVEDYTHRFSAADLNIVANNNVYLRASASAPSWVVIWSRGAGNPAVLTSIAQFKSTTGQESQSISQDGAAVTGAVSSAVTASVAGPLPAGIASLLGLSAGVQHLGAWQ